VTYDETADDKKDPDPLKFSVSTPGQHKCRVVEDYGHGGKSAQELYIGNHNDSESVGKYFFSGIDTNSMGNANYQSEYLVLKKKYSKNGLVGLRP
jgi:hypothetical protein